MRRVTRAAGRSALRALVPPVTVALIIGLLALAIMNPIVAATSRQFEARTAALSGEGSVLTLGETGLWLRQGNADGQTVIRAEGANLSGTVLDGVTFITFSPDGGPTTRIAAETATLTNGAWLLTNAKSWPLARDTTPEALANLRAELGMNDPALTRYFDWLGGVMHGDLGRAFLFPNLRPEIDPQLKGGLARLRKRFGADHRADANVDIQKVIKTDLSFTFHSVSPD